MGHKTSNNKRIVRNTIFLYFRMLLVMGVSLYSSRIVLSALGEVDYGLYSVVGGMALMFGFFSSSLSNAIQRFLNIAIGKNDLIEAKKIVSLGATTLLGLSLLILLFGEAFGLWFVYNELAIPKERMEAALWVFHTSILFLFFTINGIVFNSVLIARENFKFYAYIGVVEAITRLMIAFIILQSSGDRLKIYSVLYLLIAMIIQLFYTIYCIRKYNECKIKLYWDMQLLKQILNFVGWNTVGTIAWTLNGQGINMLINTFFGLSANAARAVSLQIETGVGNLNQGFITAVKPQVVKSYAAQKYSESIELFFNSSRFSFILLSLLSIPIIMNREFILDLWLINPPSNTADFMLWALIGMLVNSLTFPIWNSIQAIGELKKYSLISNGIYLLAFPFSLLAFHIGAPAVVAFQIIVFVRVIQILCSLLVLRSFLYFNLIKYFQAVLAPNIFILLISTAICFILRVFIEGSFILFLLDIGTVFIISLLFGLSLTEKKQIIHKFRLF